MSSTICMIYYFNNTFSTWTQLMNYYFWFKHVQWAQKRDILIPPLSVHIKVCGLFLVIQNFPGLSSHVTGQTAWIVLSCFKPSSFLSHHICSWQHTRKHYTMNAKYTFKFCKSESKGLFWLIQNNPESTKNQIRCMIPGTNDTHFNNQNNRISWHKR